MVVYSSSTPTTSYAKALGVLPQHLHERRRALVAPGHGEPLLNALPRRAPVPDIDDARRLDGGARPLRGASQRRLGVPARRHAAERPELDHAGPALPLKGEPVSAQRDQGGFLF